MTNYDAFTYREATIVQHCAVAGRIETRVRAYRFGADRRPVSLSFAFIEPRKRRVSAFLIQNNNLRYLTIECDGQVIYDSRADVPCDMTEWEAVNRKFRDRRPCSTEPATGTIAGTVDAKQSA